MASDFVDKKLRFASIMTIFIAGLLFLVKFQAFRITGSQAIFSEAMESIVNVLASVIAFYVISFSAKPADRDHPYGHGKVEYLSAALEGGLIAFAAFLIIVQALHAFYENRSLHSLDIGVILLGATGVVNLLLGFYLKYLGRAKHSVALEGSAQHLLADFWTTAGVLLGLGLVAITKIYWIDIVIAIFVSIHLIMEGYKLIRKSISGLLDEEQEHIIKQIQDLVNKNTQEGIIQVHHLRVMRSGKYHHIDAHVVVPEFWSVEEAHDNTNLYERALFKNYEFSGEIHFHIDPCRRLYCQFCNLKNCPVRKEPFKALRTISLDELTNKDEPKDIVKKFKK